MGQLDTCMKGRRSGGPVEGCWSDGETRDTSEIEAMVVYEMLTEGLLAVVVTDFPGSTTVAHLTDTGMPNKEAAENGTLILAYSVLGSHRGHAKSSWSSIGLVIEAKECSRRSIATCSVKIWRRIDVEHGERNAGDIIWFSCASKWTSLRILC